MLVNIYDMMYITLNMVSVFISQKNKKIDKKKANKVRRTDSSAATSGKQTSDGEPILSPE